MTVIASSAIEKKDEMHLHKNLHINRLDINNFLY